MPEIENTLSALGVTDQTLTSEEKVSLDQEGYLNLGQLLSSSQLKDINDHVTALMKHEGDLAGVELAASPHIKHPTEPGVDRLADLVNKGAIFDLFYTHPKVLAGIAQVLGPNIKLSSLNYRAANPGQGLQKLHVDWREAIAPGAYKVCNCIWLLDDFSKQNGATRIVPGTHKKGLLPETTLQDPWATHPDEVLIQAPAGSVFIFNSHAWHGGTVNNSTASRRAIHSYFCQRDQPQQVDQKKYILPETLHRISIAAKTLLGV